MSQLGRRSGDEVMRKGYGMVFPVGPSSINLAAYSHYRNTGYMVVACD